MKTCNIIGCPCEGTNDERKDVRDWKGMPHHPMKAYEKGFTYYAASYWHRYYEPRGTYVSLVPGKAESAAAEGAEYERNEGDFCGDETCEGCSVCNPDIIAGPEFTYQTKNLFSAAELREHRRELLRGGVVYLER